MESSATGSLKRARAPGNGATQVPSCLVDGCTADLSKCRDYHRRHKVCEIHSKTPKVTIRGQDQRFCQQCSRFHSLVEFDEGKRSCRKRLDGHNRRRRKPQPDPLSLNSTRFLSNHQGTKYIPFSSPIVFSSSTITSSWSGAIKSNANDLIQHHHHQSQLDFSNSNLFAGSQSSSSPPSQSYKGVRGGTKHFPFLETGASSATATSFPPVNISSSNGLVDTNSALSLLSSSQPDESREIGLSHHVAQADSIRLPHSTYIPCLNDYNCVGIQGEEMGGTGGGGLVSDGGKVDFSGQDLFRTRADGSSSSTSGNHQTISFSWE